MTDTPHRKLRYAMVGGGRDAFIGGGAVVRPCSAERSSAVAAAGKVDDTCRSGKDESGAPSSGLLLMGAPCFLFLIGKEKAYLKATGLPEASFTSPQALAIVAFTASGIGT